MVKTMQKCSLFTQEDCTHLHAGNLQKSMLQWHCHKIKKKKKFAI